MARRVGGFGAVVVSVSTALGALVVLTPGPPATIAVARSIALHPSTSSAPEPSVPEPSVPEQVPVLPVSVAVDVRMVGPGGTVGFSGVCPVIDGHVPGPVEVWITRLGSDGSDVVVTDITAESWAYQWMAPIDPAAFGAHRFVFWCGDPSGTSEPYPDHLTITIDMVATGPPPIPPTTTTLPTPTLPTPTLPTPTLPTTSTTVPVVEQDPPVPVLAPTPPVGALPETS